MNLKAESSMSKQLLYSIYQYSLDQSAPSSMKNETKTIDSQVF